MTPSRPARLLDLVPLAVALWVVGSLVATWAGRATYPFDLEWMEGGMLGHAWRLAHGRPLYVEPGPEWVPYIYPPGYSAVLAALGGVFGLDYTLGRLISVTGTLAAAGAIAFACWRHARGLVVGLVAAACFLGTYRASGAFMDLVRPDGLALGLTAWAVVLGAERRHGTEVASGLLLAAAFTVKHNMALLGLPIALGLLARDGWRRALGFVAASAGPGLLFTLLVQWRSGGHFLEYLLGVPGSHPMDVPRAFPGSQGELALWLLPALLVAALFATWRMVAHRRGLPLAVRLAGPLIAGAGLAWWAAGQPNIRGIGNPPDAVMAATFAGLGLVLGAVVVDAVSALVDRRLSWRWWYGVGVGGTALLIAALMRGHYGGFLNVLMPAHWALCMAFGLAVARARQLRPSLGTDLLGTLLLAGQIGWVASELELDGVVPGPADVEAGERIVARLRACDGPIFSPYDPWLAVQAGGEPSPHLIAIWDIAHRGGPYQPDVRRFAEAAAQRHWACVVDGGDRPLAYQIPKHYEVEERWALPGRTFRPRTGWPARPTTLLVPKETP